MQSLERHRQILKQLDQHDSILVADLVVLFDVSEATIRRDLDILERKGLLRRIYGGAVSSSGRSYEPSFLTRSSKFTDEKNRIGAAAAGLIHNGDSIMLDVGTTTLEIARHLYDRQNLTVITPCFQIAALLVEHPGIRLILTGGILRRGELSLVGRIAERTISEFHVDKLFMGAGGVDPVAGFTEFNLEDAQVKQAMLRNARHITVVFDASKYGNVALNALAPLTAANRIVTDTNLPPRPPVIFAHRASN
jgi:DeoR family transcriptional regulator, fructose operon transcriptional repressor